MIQFRFILMSLIFGVAASAQNAQYHYWVKAGECASEIMQKMGLDPFFIKGGSVKILAASNPQIADINTIYKGQKLNLPAVLVDRAKSNGTVVVQEGGEVVLGSSVAAPANPTATAPTPVPRIEKPIAMPSEPKAPTPVVEEKASEPARWYLLAGLGADSISFKQSGTETQSLDYASSGIPTASLGLGVRASGGAGAELHYSRNPGRIKSPTISINSDNFNWASIRAEGFYPLMKNWNIRLGVESHDLPYMQFSSSTQAEVRLHKIWLGSLGTDFRFPFSDEWEGIGLLKYLLPVSQASESDKFELKKPSAFGAALGVDRKVSEHLKWGLLWNLSSQKYDYSMVSTLSGAEDNGKVEFLLSVFEAHLTYLF